VEENKSNNYNIVYQSTKLRGPTMLPFLLWQLISLTTCYVKQMNYEKGKVLRYNYIRKKVDKIEVLTNR